MAEKSRQEFSQGFLKGVSYSLSAYSIYAMVTSVAEAADSNTPATNSKTPGDTGGVQPSPNSPNSKPGFKPLFEGTKGTFVGGAFTICAAALQSGDFYLGLGCAFMLIIGGIGVNRAQP
jgi:hypothetical protein